MSNYATKTQVQYSAFIRAIIVWLLAFSNVNNYYSVRLFTFRCTYVVLYMLSIMKPSLAEPDISLSIVFPLAKKKCRNTFLTTFMT